MNKPSPPFPESSSMPTGLGDISANSVSETVSSESSLVGVGKKFARRAIGKTLPDHTLSWLLAIPAAIALAISSYLAYVAVTGSEVAGCGSGVLDCGHVLHSKYSKFLGFPVSFLATSTYLVMLGALAAIPLSRPGGGIRRLAWTIVSLCGLSAGLAALWFVSLQIFVIGHFCPWCLGAHACGLVIAIAIVVTRPVGMRLTLAAGGFAAAGLAGLIAVQVSADEPKKFEIIKHPTTSTEESTDKPKAEEEADVFAPPLDETGEIFEAPIDDSDDSVQRTDRGASFQVALMSLFSNTSMVTWQEGENQENETQEDEEGATQDDEPRLVTITGNVKLNPRQWPMIGSPDARYVFVEMFDYACPHCRATHRAIKGACENFGDELGVVVLPVPLNTQCNSAITATQAAFAESCELAELAVACWRVDPSEFEKFHHWMFEGNQCPSYRAAKAKVDSLVGKEKIDEELRKEAPRKYIDKHVLLYKRAGRGNVPKLLFAESTVVGEYTSTQGLIDMIKRYCK